jgi:hypothetical protein
MKSLNHRALPAIAFLAICAQLASSARAGATEIPFAPDVASAKPLAERVKRLAEKLDELVAKAESPVRPAPELEGR